MASKIIIWYLTKGHYRKTRTIDKDRSSSQTEAIAIIPTTMLAEGRASCQDSVVWVGMCPTQVPRGIRIQDRVASPFTRSIRISLPRIPNLVWVEGWSSIMARVSLSGTRGRGCSAEVMVAYLRDSLDTVPQIAEEDRRNLSKIEELTTRVAISTQQVALIRSRRTWESWTPVYLPRYS